MKVVEITTSQFRQSQKKYFDMVAQGVQVVVYRGTELFKIMPVKKADIFDEEAYFTPQIKEKIDKAIEETERGEVEELTPELKDKLFAGV